MKKVLSIFILFSTLLLTGCSCDNENKRLNEGLVVDKIFDEGYTYTTYIKSGNNMHPVINRISDKWYIVLYKDERIDKREVSEYLYEKINIGDYIDLTEKED